MKYDVCIVGGCGHVGLPLALCFAKEGKQVAILDINPEAVDLVASGRMPFREDGADEILRQVLDAKRLHPSTDANVVSESDAVVLILGTPIDEHLNPSFSVIARSVKQCMPYLRDGQLVVLRSTVYPGTTEKIDRMIKEAGISVDVTFCPERILEGHAIEETHKLPQIISGFSPEGVRRVKDLFSAFTDDFVEVTLLEAELAKIYSNVWRYISFAVANEFYSIANDHNADYYRIREAMTHNYPRAKDLPRAGFAAGPCLFKDTMQLSTFADNRFFLGHAAMLINEGQPGYLVSKLKEKYPLSDMVVGILGMAFKGDSDDPRESLSYKLKKILASEAKEVLTADPYVKDDRLKSVEYVADQSDLLILATPHKVYKDLDLKGKPVVDIWNFFGRGSTIK